MITKPKIIVTVICGGAYFLLFSLLGQIANLKELQLFFLTLFAGFEYVGIEKFLCLDTNNNKVFCKAGELFFCGVVVPCMIYSALSAFNTDLFSPSAIVSLGTIAYRIVWFPIEKWIKK